MARIEDLITKTLLSVQYRMAMESRSYISHPRLCFELFGFDILIDEDFKPWLLEVNLSPSLNWYVFSLVLTVVPFVIMDMLLA